jgi:hypothetical protein
MSEAQMLADLTMLIVHLAALVLFISLYKRAPCWMQKIAVVGWSLAMLAISIGYAMSMFDAWGSWYVLLLGQRVEHLAVLLYAFRLVYQGHLEWKPSSAPSRSL